MQPSSKAVHALGVLYGMRLRAYDQGGVPRIGCHHAAGVQKGDVITREQAEELLDEDIAAAAAEVNRLVVRPLTQGQFDALFLYCFDVGPVEFATSAVLEACNAGTDAETWAAFSEHDKAPVNLRGGSVVIRISTGRLQRRLIYQRFFRDELKAS